MADSGRLACLIIVSVAQVDQGSTSLGIMCATCLHLPFSAIMGQTDYGCHGSACEPHRVLVRQELFLSVQNFKMLSTIINRGSVLKSEVYDDLFCTI